MVTKKLLTFARLNYNIMAMTSKICALLLVAAALQPATAQDRLAWGDQGNGTYINPVLNADYSDPDVIRVGEKYYMTASDFHYMGMQVLESSDMVNWRIVSQIFDRLRDHGVGSTDHFSALRIWMFENKFVSLHRKT